MFDPMLTLAQFLKRAAPHLKALNELIEQANMENVPQQSGAVMDTDGRGLRGIRTNILELLRAKPGMTTAELAQALHTPATGITLDLMRRRCAVHVSVLHKDKHQLVGIRPKGDDVRWYLKGDEPENDKGAEAPSS